MQKPTIIVHGGAGAIHPSLWPKYKAGAHAAAKLGQQLLDNGSPAVDAAVAAVVLMEDNHIFNAGTGAALTSEGKVECDAMVIVDGLRSGSVAAVSGVRNPVKLAQVVLDKTPHKLIAGPGALLLATQHGIETCDEADLIVPRRKKRFDQLKAKGATFEENINPEDVSDDPEHGDESCDTIGACALDSQGRMAVASSTGGIMMQLPGRVGDTPIIGAGSFCGPGGSITCTGHGEAVMRICLSKYCYDLLADGLSAKQAASQSIKYMVDEVDGFGGILLVDCKGNRAWATSTSHITIGIPEEIVDAREGNLPA